jgi:pimeloyl-ACP methyl ester carboxylesterase
LIIDSTTLDAASSPTVVFIHGFLDDASIWAGVEEVLEGADQRSVSLDLAGSGERRHAGGPFTLQRLAADVIAVLADIDGPVVLAGQSMGAQVAELVAAAQPDRVAGLVLLTPVPLAGTHLPEDEIAPFRSLGGQRDRQRAVRIQLSASLRAEDLEHLVEIGTNVPAEVVPQLADAWNEGDPGGGSPSRYVGPVVIVRGESDPFVTAGLLQDGVIPRFPGARVETVKGAGHWVHVEQPAAVAHVVRTLLAHLAGSETGAGNTAAAVTPQGWTTAFAEKTPDAFGKALTSDVRLEGSALCRPIEGRDQVKATMAAASAIYESLVFTHEARAGHRDYLEWDAQAFGGVRLAGVTILTKDDAGQITDIAIHHRPLQATLTFSATLGERLAGVVDPSHFFGQ